MAPYEADAQLAYLCKAGTISAVITEDSDLLTYGCPRVIFKLDKDGNGVEINQSDFGMIKEMRFWDIDRFRQMCILSGCDYLDSPRGIGLKKALKLLHRTDAYKLIDMWKNWGQSVKAPVLPADYSSKFKVADLVFLYQRVYCPKKKGMVTLNTLDIPLDEELSNAIGPYFSFNTSLLDDDIAHRIAIGEIHPMTKAAFTNQDACSIIAAGRLSLPPSNKPKRFIKLADDECEIALSCNHVENKENIPPGSECIVSEAAKSIPDKPKVQTSTLFSISLKEKVLTPVNSDIEKHTSSIPLKRASPFSFPQLLKKPGSHIPRGIGFSISKTSIPTKSPYFTAVSESKPAAFKTNAETTAPIVPKRKTLGLRSINI